MFGFALHTAPLLSSAKTNRVRFRYQFNPHLLHPETTTNILMKALTVFPSPAFSLSLALLPTSTVPFALNPPNPSANGTDNQKGPLPPSTDFTDSIQKLTLLNTLLESSQYTQFWFTFNSDDIYADLAADIAGFEELIRIRIAIEVGKAYREIDLDTLGQWLNLKGGALEKFVGEVCGWKIRDGGKRVEVPRNRENEARSEVKGERVGVDMFGRVFRRGFEQPA